MVCVCVNRVRLSDIIVLEVKLELCVSVSQVTMSNWFLVPLSFVQYQTIFPSLLLIVWCH